jgi:hypothetical protein
MASNELKAFLGNIDESYEQYADQLHDSSFTMIKELAAASPELLELRAKVPIGSSWCHCQGCRCVLDQR